MAKYYAVKKGRNPGIYRSWEECKEQVLGFQGASYKSFKSKDEAEVFVKNDENGKEKEESVEEKSLIAYVDGSYVEGNQFGSGCVLLYQNEIIDKISRNFLDEDLAKMRNVAGEIKAAELAMQYAIEHGYESVILYHDYEGIAKWCLGEWKTNKEGTKAYKAFYEAALEVISISFRKVKGHSGDEYNELADALAKKAIM